MMNFRHLGWFDTFAVVAHLHKLAPHTWKGMQYRGEIGDQRLPVKSTPLRGHNKPTVENWLEDLPVADLDLLTKWKSMQRLLAQARKTILADEAIRNSGLLDPAGIFGRVMISDLAKQSVIAWHQDNGPYHDKHARFHIPLLTNPMCLMYSGAEITPMRQGELWLFNNRAWHSAANWGMHPRIHLIFEMRRASPDDE